MFRAGGFSYEEYEKPSKNRVFEGLKYSRNHIWTKIRTPSLESSDRHASRWSPKDCILYSSNLSFYDKYKEYNRNQYRWGSDRRHKVKDWVCFDDCSFNVDDRISFKTGFQKGPLMKTQKMLINCLVGMIILAMGYEYSRAQPKANTPSSKIGVVNIFKILRHCKRSTVY